MTTILHLDASGRHTGSHSRALTQMVIDHLDSPNVEIIRRDLAEPKPELVDEAWIFSNFTPEADRTDGQKAHLAASDELVAELQKADIIVLGVPIYNFSVPAAFKAWIDLVARAGVTFQYTETGPQGLLQDKRAIVVHTSGGTPVGSDIDYASDYTRHVLGFLGITDVQTVAADGLMGDESAGIAKAKAQIEALKLDARTEEPV
ncbi:FMN-dependent NADH-azoreductase [Erythrobacter rubeus]|uniref:FMN dependent NADH:quinone oxidoreductase n=1 Tax=Erythrobacter rubeus TaxID=2760803 RepID=A0ABR8KPU9_9SPHN|nr:NAD(P)H-dependent oxidoreductase [Erythrobacter rubeus]MBD2841904.1 NAD(P)H-dependent oxidoreductase [Erythrobacter rubeus]